jgi:hypothetical protein
MWNIIICILPNIIRVEERYSVLGVEALCYKRKGSGIESRWGGFYNLPNPSSRTMALESTKPLKEMCIRNLPRGKGRPARKANNITAIFEPIV